MQENTKYKIVQKIESVTWSMYHLKLSQELEVIKSSWALLMFIDTKQCFYSKTNRMHNISNLFYFGTTLCVFLSIHHQESKTLHTASGICHTGSVTAQGATEPVWHMPVAVFTVIDSWWWTEKQSETCRVLFKNKINLRYCASGWFYYRNILWCTVLQMSKNKQCLPITLFPDDGAQGSL